MNNTCDICSEKFNLSTRSKAECPYCQHSACRECYKKWLLIESRPRCMNNDCNVEWTQNNLIKIFPYTFIKGDFKKHRENVLFDRERALLPATQPVVEQRIQREIIANEMEAINKEMIEVRGRYNAARNRLYSLNTNVQTERSTFVRACPDEECRGFLSSQWKCGICQKWSCPNCHEVKGENRDCEHVCDPDRVATATLLANDTRPCPSCGTGIFKIDGCFAENTKILLWDSTYKNSQDICVGDVLIGDNGHKRIVEKIFTGEDNLYEINQNNGETYVVNSKHTLALKFMGTNRPIWHESLNAWKMIWFDIIEKKVKTKTFKVTETITMELAKETAEEFVKTLTIEDVVLITVEDYMKLDNTAKRYLYGFKSSEGIHYTDMPISLDPYMLGLWLGDGTHTKPIIASNGKEIDKTRIPREFITNSRENRLKLLAGLIDATGDPLVRGFAIMQSDDQLRNQIDYLAQSLGFQVYYDDQLRVIVTGERLDEIPTKVLMKYPQLTNNTNKDYFRTIIDVKLVGIGKYFGWTVNENSRFILPDFTVVKNCDQMFCTNCNTGFSWRTGRIETNIHNPHYFEWLRRTGGNVDRNPNEVQCGQEITSRFSRDLVMRIRNRRDEIESQNLNNNNNNETEEALLELKPIIDKVTRICENVIHNRYAALDRYRTDHITDNQELRIRFLRNQVSEAEFKTLLQREDKRIQKYRSIFNVFIMLNTTITDIIYRFNARIISDEFIRDANYRSDTYKVLNETHEIAKYANDCLSEISQNYKSKLLQVTPHGRIK